MRRCRSAASHRPGIAPAHDLRWERWRAHYCGCEFDFGDEADFRRDIDLFLEMVRKRYSRARACTPMMARQHMGWRGMLYRLRAKVDIAAIAEEEVRATGWDRSDYSAR